MTERRAISPPAHERTFRCTSPRRLDRSELPLDTIELARYLIGKSLVRPSPDVDGEPLVARIVETEAYLPNDAASHAFRGATARTAAMFGEPGRAYIYFIYGNHFCFNVTSERAGIGAAVLVRAAEPILGHALMSERRGARVPVRDLLRGPGRLSQALQIDRRLDGVDLCSSPDLWLAEPADDRVFSIETSARIGITKNATAPLRFFAADNRWVSARKLQDSASRARF